MRLDDMLAEFDEVCVGTLDYLRSVPDQLQAKGFTQTRTLNLRQGSGITAICLEHPDLPYGYSYLREEDGAVSSCAIMIPDAPSLREGLIGYAQRQERAEEVTDHMWQFLAFVPDEIAASLIDGRFWTSKPRGIDGRNFSVTGALFKLRGAVPALALTVDRNLSLQDPMAAEDWDALCGPDSKLQRCVDIFHRVGLACAPDVDALERAARMLEFYGEPPEDNGFCYSGGPGNRGTSIHVNQDTKFDFEFALTFGLDERIPAETVRQTLHTSLGIEETTEGGLRHYDGAWGEVDLRGARYRVGVYCISQLFGNHAFLLQK